MKLTLKIKLLPTHKQAALLLDTIKEANTVCNAISEVAWQEKIFNNFKLHHKVYHPYKATFQLSSQILIRQIAKVADDADINASKNIATLGRAVNHAGRWNDMCCIVHSFTSKAQTSLVVG